MRTLYTTRRLFLHATFALLAAIAVGCGGTSSSGSRPASAPDVRPRRVAFDVDDTLLFSTPAFDKAEASGYEWGSDSFWTIVNTSDRELSRVKRSVLAIVREHQAAGDEIYVITARREPGGEALREFIEDAFGIPRDHVLFEPDGKVERMKSLGIEVFYGDSDSDITDAMEAGAEPVRILRSPKSDYKVKYNPGKYGERIIPGTEE